jgi:hypothetical protein
MAGVLSFSVEACTTELSTEGAGVRIGKGAPEEAVCQELGVVYGSGGGGGYTSSEDKLRSAENELRNKTAEMGGNFVIMDASGSDLSGMTMSGRALRCTARPPGAIPVARNDVARAPAPVATQTPEQRIRALDELHQKGLVTDDEYQQRRKEILQSL